MDFGERHDTWTNGQHYTADRRPTNQVRALQAERNEETTAVEFQLYIINQLNGVTTPQHGLSTCDTNSFKKPIN